MPRPAVRHTAHLILAVTGALVAAGALLSVVNLGAPTVGGSSVAHQVGQLALAGLFAAAGWLLATRRPGISYGWLALAAGLGHALSAAGAGWAVYALKASPGLAGADAGVLAGFVGEPLENVALAVFLTTFPSGRWPDRWLRHAARSAVGLCVAGWVVGIFTRLPTQQAYSGLRNPLGLLPDTTPVEVLFASGLLLGSVVVVVRWRRSAGTERQVLRWLAVVNLAAIALTPAVVLLPAGEAITVVAIAVELVVVVAVVLAHRVFGLTIVLNRTLVYVVLLGAIALVYAGFVAVAAALGHRALDPGWAVGVAFAAALALAPARTRVQRLVNTFLYGNRDEPYTVVSRIADRLEASASVEELLPSLLDAITGELRLPWAQVELCLEDGDVRRIRRGNESAPQALRLDLAPGHGRPGALTVGRRPGQDSLTASEVQLLRNIAAQVGVAARNVLLTEALLRSRERVVQASEDERRRMRRDLHDGLGPVLTAAVTKLDAAGNLLGTDHALSLAVINGVRDELGTALKDLRRLVYALHPPALDDLGLLASLRQQLPRMGVPVALTAPAALPPLPAPVAVAAYRIVGEAVTNAARHSAASRCSVTVTCTDRLRVEVLDNGTRRAPWQPGLGLTSMRERVDALGGVCIVGPTDHGGLVTAEFPLPQPDPLPVVAAAVSDD